MDTVSARMQASTVASPAANLATDDKPDVTMDASPVQTLALPCSDSSLSPSLVAQIGFEFEMGGIQIVPFLPRGTLLASGQGWQLETDRIPNQEKSDLEFVLSPMSRIDDIETAAREVIGLVSEMRRKALLSPRREVPLEAVIKGARTGYRIKVNNIRFDARLQVTYGIGLKEVATYVKRLLSNRLSMGIQLATETVAAFFHAQCGESLSETAKGMVALINCYLQSAKCQPKNTGTVHAFFPLMTRSDFCSIYDKLLDEVSLQQIKRLLIPAPGKDIPGIMEALSLNSEDLVFAHPYFNKMYQKEPGPKIREWLASIACGRGEGRLKKDLLSPPAGYPLHTGNLDVDYGMGAFGVDEINQLILFEIRAARHRPGAIPMNAQIRCAIVREYADAQECNRSLENIEEISPVLAERYAFLRQCGVVYRALRRISSNIRNQGRDLTDEGWQKIAAGDIANARQDLAELMDGLAHSANENLSSLLAPGMREMQAILDRLCRTPTQLPMAHHLALLLSRYKTTLRNFEEKLWDAENSDCP